MVFCWLALGLVLVAGTEQAGRRDVVVAQALALTWKEVTTHWLVTGLVTEGDSAHDGFLQAGGKWEGHGHTQNLLGWINNTW